MNRRTNETPEPQHETPDLMQALQDSVDRARARRAGREAVVPIGTSLSPMHVRDHRPPRRPAEVEREVREDESWLDPDSVKKWRAAAEAARRSEHHFPADCLAEAIDAYARLTKRLDDVEREVRERLEALADEWLSCSNEVSKFIDAEHAADLRAIARSIGGETTKTKES